MIRRRHVVAFVARPSNDLRVRTLNGSLRNAKLTTAGHAIVPLALDEAKTYELTPDEWQEEDGKLGSVEGKTPPMVFTVPKWLQEESLRFQLQAYEFGRIGEGANIVAALNGAPLIPLFTSGRRMKGDWHNSSLYTGRALAFVAWTKKSLCEAELQIRCEELVLVSGHLVMIRQDVLPPLGIGMNLDCWPKLSDGLGDWKPAIDALQELLRCTQCATAHYDARSV